MRRYYIGAMLIAFAICVQAQNAPVRTNRAADRNTQQASGANTNRSTELSVRAQMMNEQLTQEIGNARWVRNILRELDLTKEKNAPLYYPVQEMNGMKNLFTTLFHLFSEEKIKAYNYRADYESFEEDNLLSFQDMLKQFKILYDAVPGSGNLPVRYIINASDIPSREVNKLYVKEAWFFDQKNSTYDVKTLAICPIAEMTLESGEELRQGMFWVKYEDIRPFIKNNYIMTSNINNAKTYTMDDFFRRRMYDGEIIQTDNLMNLPLAMLFDKNEIAEEQQRIENQLRTFNEALWIQPDTTTVVLNKREARKTTTVTRGSTVKAPPKEKAPKQAKTPPAEKAASTKSAPTRSIRR